jgi:thiol-disulfide isomerase/thioredoxin
MYDKASTTSRKILKECSSHAVLLALAMILVLLAPSPSMAAGALEGQTAADFTITDLAGQVQSLEGSLGGNVLLLDFWSIYCVACIQEMPHIVSLYNKYKDKGLSVLGINLDSFGARRVKKYIAGMDYEIPFPVAIDKKREMAKGYNVSVLPTTVLVGKNGKVEMYHIGYKPGDEDMLEEKILQLLK